MGHAGARGIVPPRRLVSELPLRSAWSCDEKSSLRKALGEPSGGTIPDTHRVILGAFRSSVLSFATALPPVHPRVRVQLLRQVHSEQGGAKPPRERQAVTKVKGRLDPRAVKEEVGLILGDVVRY